MPVSSSLSLFSAQRLRPKLDCSDLQLYGYYRELGSSPGAKRPPPLPAHLAGGRDPPKLIQPRGSSCQQDRQACHDRQRVPVYKTEEVFPLRVSCDSSHWCRPRLQPHPRHVPEDR